MVGKKTFKGLLRDIKLNKNMFLLLVLIIVIGTGIYVGLESTYQNMLASSSYYYNETNLFDIQINSEVGFSKSDLTEVENLGEVSGVMPVKTLDVSSEVNNDYYNGKLISLNTTSEDNNNYVNQITLVRGNEPTTINEGLIDEEFFSKNGLEIGDLITLNPDDSNDLRAKKIKIVGTFKSSYYSSLNEGEKKVSFYLYLPESNFTKNYYNYVFITLKSSSQYSSYEKKYKSYVNETKEKIKEKINGVNDDKKESMISELESQIENAKNSLHLLSQSEDHLIEAEKEELNLKLTNYQNKIIKLKNDVISVTTRLEHDGFYEYQSEAKNINKLSSSISFMFLFVTVVATIVTSVHIIEKQKDEIKTLLALGYGKLTVSLKYLLYVLTAGLLGSLIGSLLFYKIIPLAFKYYYSNAYGLIVTKTYLNDQKAFFSVLFVTITSTVATLVVFLVKNKNLPLTIKHKKKKIGFIKKVYDLIKQKKHAISVFLLSFLLLIIAFTLFGYKDSNEKTIEKEYSLVNKYDLKITFNQTDDSYDVANKLSNNDDVTIKKTYEVDANITSKDNEVTACFTVLKNSKNLSNFISLKSEDESLLKLNDKGVIISSSLANKLNVKKNDTITISLSGNNAFKVKVTGIFKNYFGNYVYISKELFKDVNKQNTSYNTLLLNYDDDLKNAEKNKLENEIENESSVLSVTKNSDAIKTYQGKTTFTHFVFYFLMVLLSLFTVLNLVYVLLLTNYKNKKDIICLKAIGYYNNEINRYFMKDYFIALVIALVLAVAFGSLISCFIINDLSTSDFTYAFKINVTSYLLVILLVFVMSLVLGLFNHNMIEKEEYK